MNAAVEKGELEVIFKSDLISIASDHVLLKVGEETWRMPNDLVYIFAGGELPTGFLQKAGIEITKRFGHIVKKLPANALRTYLLFCPGAVRWCGASAIVPRRLDHRPCQAGRA